VPCNEEKCTRSKNGQMECMKAITVEEVFSELNKALEMANNL
jgi:hypothetical protein